MVHLPPRDGNTLFADAASTMADAVRVMGPNPLRVPPDAGYASESEGNGSIQVSPEDAVLAKLGLL
jgi:hypothetical protein